MRCQRLSKVSVDHRELHGRTSGLRWAACRVEAVAEFAFSHDGLVPEFCTVHGLGRILHGSIESDTPDLLEAVVKHSVLAARFIANRKLSLKRQRIVSKVAYTPARFHRRLFKPKQQAA